MSLRQELAMQGTPGLQDDVRIEPTVGMPGITVNIAPAEQAPVTPINPLPPVAETYTPVTPSPTPVAETWQRGLMPSKRAGDTAAEMAVHSELPTPDVSVKTVATVIGAGALAIALIAPAIWYLGS